MSGIALFSEELVFLEPEIRTQQELFQWFFHHMQAEGYVKNSYYQSIIMREQKYPTGLQTSTIGVAIPHADAENLEKPFIAVVRPCRSIAFEPMGSAEETVQAELIFMLGVLKNGEQVIALQNLMGLLCNEEAVRGLLKAENAEKIIRIIKENFQENE